MVILESTIRTRFIITYSQNRTKTTTSDRVGLVFSAVEGRFFADSSPSTPLENRFWSNEIAVIHHPPQGDFEHEELLDDDEATQVASPFPVRVQNDLPNVNTARRLF